MQPVRILGARAGQILPHILPEIDRRPKQIHQDPFLFPAPRFCAVKVEKALPKSCTGI